MAALAEITTVAKAAAERALRPTEVVEVRVKPEIGSTGDEVLWITVIVPENKFDAIDEDHWLDAMLDIGRKLRETGDERQAVVKYATPSGVEDYGDPES